MAARRVALLVAVCVAVAAALPAAAGTGAKPTPDTHACVPPGRSTTLVRNLYGRIYTARAKVGGPFLRTAAFVCSTRSGRTFRVGTDLATVDANEPPDPGEVKLLSFSLSRVAAAWVVSSAQGTEVRELSLRTGKIIRRAPASSTVFVVQSDAGYLAWIDPGSDGPCRPTCEVHLYNPVGNRVVASGTNIDPSSIGTSVTRVPGVSTSYGLEQLFYWVDGGRAQFEDFKRP